MFSENKRVVSYVVMAQTLTSSGMESGPTLIGQNRGTRHSGKDGSVCFVVFCVSLIGTMLNTILGMNGSRYHFDRFMV